MSTKIARSAPKSKMYPRRHYPESEVRQRIRGLIEAGGIHPISSTGEKNLAGLFNRSIQQIKVIIAEESRQIGEEVTYA